MNLIYFTQEAYKSIKKDVQSNNDRYYSNEEWLEDYFEEKGISEFYRTSTVKVDEFEFQYSGEDDECKKADDIQNTIFLYSAFRKKITPAQAADPCLWTALCHIPYKNYVMKRWRKKDDTVSIDRRFCATEGRNSLLYYNAISRLWWSGYLTYEEAKEKSDPWQLTRILFSAQQIQKDLFDQPFCMNRVIVQGLLRALKRIQEERGNASTPVFRKCCDSYINHYGAVSILDSLTSEEIEEIAYAYMKSITE